MDACLLTDCRHDMMPLEISNAQMSDLVAFNKQLREYQNAGVPLQWPTGTENTDFETGAELASKELAYGVTLGQSLFEALRSNTTVPEAYKLSFLAWLVTDRSPYSFDLLKRMESREPVTLLRGSWFLYSKVLIVLGTIAFLIWQFTGAVALKALYLESSFPPGPIGRISIYLHDHFVIPLLAFDRSSYANLVVLIAIPFVVFFVLQSLTKLFLGSAYLNNKQRHLFDRSNFIRILLNQGFPIQTAFAIQRSVVSHSADSSTSPSEPETLNSDEMMLHAQLWGTEKKLGQKMRRSSIQYPYFIVMLTGGLLVLLLAISIFIPTFEFIYSLNDERGF